jgi:hypothetical protein
LYLYLETRHHIHLLLLLDKNEQEDAIAEQRKQIGSGRRKLNGTQEAENGKENQSEHL